MNTHLSLSLSLSDFFSPFQQPSFANFSLFVCLFLRSSCLRASDLTDRRLCYKWYKNHYETLVIIYTHSRLLFKSSHTNECGRELPKSGLSLSLCVEFSLPTTTTTLPRFSQKHFGEAPIHPPSKNKAATYPEWRTNSLNPQTNQASPLFLFSLSFFLFCLLLSFFFFFFFPRSNRLMDSVQWSNNRQ